MKLAIYNDTWTCMAYGSKTLFADFDIEVFLTSFRVLLQKFLSRKKAQERVLLIICLNDLLQFIISRKLGSLIWI